jgi:hypothetical protein
MEIDVTFTKLPDFVSKDSHRSEHSNEMQKIESSYEQESFGDSERIEQMLLEVQYELMSLYLQNDILLKMLDIKMDIIKQLEYSLLNNNTKPKFDVCKDKMVYTSFGKNKDRISKKLRRFLTTCSFGINTTLLMPSCFGCGKS